MEVATFLRDDAELALDFLSNVTGVDWLDKEIAEKVKVTQAGHKTVDGVEQMVEETVEETRKHVEPGYLEAVYHLYSMAKKHGPVVLRMRTVNRTDKVELPSLTPVWRSAEFQEREVFDLFGIVFTGHPDLRRLLMWEEFKDHPMRRDYVEPDDFEYEPTAHDEVLERAKAHKAGNREQGGSGRGQEGAVQSDFRFRGYSRRRRSEGWNRPPVIEPDGEGELLEVSMGPHHPSTHGVFRMDVALDGERVVRLKPVFGYLHRNHEKIAESDELPGIDAVHGPAGLFLLADQQLGVCAGGGEAGGAGGAGARRVYPRDYGGADAGAEPRLGDRISDPGDGRERHAADVCVPGAREDSRSVREPDRIAHDVQLHALRRLPRGCVGGWLDATRKVVAGLPGFVDEFEALLTRQRDSDGAHARAWACCGRNWR